VKVCPPAVIVALRLVPAVFTATLYPTDPVPEPDDPLVTVSQEALLVALHAHPVWEVTVKVDDPPPAAMELEVGVSEYVQLPDTEARKLATVLAVLLSARTLFCVDVPVGIPL
jgi:hypothetical protein